MYIQYIYILHTFLLIYLLSSSNANKKQEVQTVFERYVGPITHCNVLEDAASITFLSPDHAQVKCCNFGAWHMSTSGILCGHILVIWSAHGLIFHKILWLIGFFVAFCTHTLEHWLGTISSQLCLQIAICFGVTDFQKAGFWPARLRSTVMMAEWWKSEQRPGWAV